MRVYSLHISNAHACVQHAMYVHAQAADAWFEKDSGNDSGNDSDSEEPKSRKKRKKKKRKNQDL